MFKRIKKMWLKALRDGSYKQGHGCLREVTAVVDGKEVVQYCCLGVLTDLYVQSPEAKKARAKWSTQIRGHLVCRGRYAGSCDLPKRVMKWAGLDSANPRIAPSAKASDETAIDQNDGGSSFKKIATLIERNL